MARRRGIWIPTNSGSTVAAGGQSNTNLLALMPLDLEAIGGLTVERIVGEMKFRCDTVGTYQLFSAGICVRHEDLGTADLATGLTSEAGDWMWQLHTRTSGMFTEVAAGDFDGVDDVRFIDVRVARKLRAEENLRFIINNDAGQSLNFNIGVRTYVLLP